jgi:acetyl esterase/lipase
MDLAQALRRAGWAELTFHYRGSWGSEGSFSIDHVLEDADAVTAFARGAGKAWNIDPARIVLMGHSMGGLAAAHATAGAPDRMATVLIAPWDPSILATLLRPLPVAEREASARDRWGDVSHGRLTGITAQEIAAQIVDHGERWRLADSAPTAANRPLLIVTAARDLASSQAGGLKDALTARQGRFDTVQLDSNHSFEDHRIALESLILTWLAKLPGAPHP